MGIGILAGGVVDFLVGDTGKEPGSGERANKAGGAPFQQGAFEDVSAGLGGHGSQLLIDVTVCFGVLG